METHHYGGGIQAFGLPSETSLEGWKLDASTLGDMTIEDFRNFLRGMETLFPERSAQEPEAFRNFLRGMETYQEGIGIVDRLYLPKLP